MSLSNGTKEKKNIFREYPLTVLVSAFMVLMLLGYIFGPQHEFSDVENRYLQLRPAISLAGLKDGSFMENFDTYTDEQIPLRSMLVKVKTLVDTVVLKGENHGIAKGKEGYLFDKSTDDLSTFEQNLSIIDKFIKNSDRKVYVAFAPTSVAVNADRLPLGMPVLDEQQMDEDVRLIMSVNSNAIYVNLYDAMMNHKDEDIYYRTDHHWKVRGAYYAYEKLCEAMSDAPQIKAVNLDEIAAHSANDFYGTFYAKYQAPGIKGDTIEYIDVPNVEYETTDGTYNSIYDESKLEIYDKYAMFMYGNFGRATVKMDGASDGEASDDGTDTRSSQDEKVLVIFKDSYANSLIPFLTYHYDRIEIADLRYLGGSAQELLQEYPEADVLMLYNYSFLNEDKHFYKLLK